MSILQGSIQILYKTAAAYTLANFTLLAGQEGVESDTGFRKVGDGSTAWNSLGYNSVLSKLQDVVLTSPVSGDVIQYDGSKWINASSSADVLNTVLTGFSTGANSTILSSDTVLQGFEKAQGQINARVQIGTLTAGFIPVASSSTTITNGFLSQSGNNLIVPVGKFITSAAGTLSQINLAVGSTDGYVGITSDGGVGAQGFMVVNSTTASLGFNIAGTTPLVNGVNVTNTAADLRHTTITNVSAISGTLSGRLNIDADLLISINDHGGTGTLDIGSTTSTLMNGSFQYTGSTPTNGYVLTTDASGNATWKSVTSIGAWSITGNSGTTAGTNFVGTTDNQDLIFKRNSVASGWLTLVSGNTSFGVGGMTKTVVTSGVHNTMIGSQSGIGITTGQDNTIVGWASGTLMVSAQRNVGVGAAALNITTGSANTGIGYGALQTNTTGSFLTALGHNADVGSSGLTDSTAIGSNSVVSSSHMVVLGSSTVTAVGFNGALEPFYSSAYQSGTSGQVLTSQGSGVAPQWTTSSATIGGSIDVNQIAYGSALNTITGSAAAIFNTSTGDVLFNPLSSSDNYFGIDQASATVFIGDFYNNGDHNYIGINSGTDVVTIRGSGGVTFPVSSINIATVPYSFPSSQGAANTYLKNDGSGNLTWATTTSGTVTSVSGTTSRITVATGTTTPVIDISASYVGQSSITTLGTITTGVWNGTAIANANLANSSTTINGTTIALGASGTVTAAAGTLTGTTLNSTVVTSSLTSVGTIATGVWNGTIVTGTYGGTGVNNGASTITIGGSHVLSGAFTSTFTFSNTTSVTFPTSGTLATLAGSEAFTNKTITSSTNTLGGVTMGLGSDAVGDMYYAGTSNVLTRLAAVAAGSYLRSAGTTTAPVWSTLILPNSATAAQVVFASATNTYGASSGFTFSATSNDILFLQGTSAGSRTGVNIGAAGASTIATCAVQNNRGVFASYGWIMCGGTTTATAYCGITMTDKVGFIADGGNNLGMVISVTNAQPLTIGTNNTTRCTISGAGLTTWSSAYHVLAAGTASAATAPLKYTSGTNLTTAETGAMEYNGTNLFFTRTGTTRESVWVGNDGASAPATNNIGVILDYYGTSATRVLTTPNSWGSVVVAGTTYKIALYS